MGGQNYAAATSLWGKRQAGWIPEPGWAGAENFTPTRIPSTDPLSTSSKAETKIKTLKFNVIVFKSQSNAFCLRVATKCTVQPTVLTRSSISIIRALTWTVFKVLFLFYKNTLSPCYKNSRLTLSSYIIGAFCKKCFERHNWAKLYNVNLFMCKVTTNFNGVTLVTTQNAAFHFEYVTMMRQLIATLKLTQKYFSF